MAYQELKGRGSKTSTDMSFLVVFNTDGVAIYPSELGWTKVEARYTKLLGRERQVAFAEYQDDVAPSPED